MPVKRFTDLKPDMGRILNRAGAKGKSQLKPQLLSAVEELLRFIDDSGLLNPAVCYEQYGVSGVNGNEVLLENGVALYIPRRIFKEYEIREVSTAVSTIGPALEEESARLFARREAFKGFLLDSIGSAAIDMLSQQACSIIELDAAERHLCTSSPVCPGMFNIPIMEQEKLVELAGADRIGVSMLATCEMMPRKTVSLIMVTGTAMPSWSKEHVCRTCNLSKTCQYRRVLKGNS
jgi:hypothetical protein